jgi:hypothetical protein
LGIIVVSSNKYYEGAVWIGCKPFRAIFLIKGENRWGKWITVRGMSGQLESSEPDVFALCWSDVNMKRLHQKHAEFIYNFSHAKINSLGIGGKYLRNMLASRFGKQD